MQSHTLHPDVSSSKGSRRRRSDGGSGMNRHPHPNPNADSKNEWNTQSKLSPSPSAATAAIATGSLDPNEHDPDADRQTAGWTSAGPVKAQRSLPVPPPRRQVLPIQQKSGESANVTTKAHGTLIHFHANSTPRTVCTDTHRNPQLLSLTQQLRSGLPQLPLRASRTKAALRWCPGPALLRGLRTQRLRQSCSGIRASRSGQHYR